MIKIIITITTLLLSMLSFSQTEEKNLQADIRGRDCHGGSGLCSIMPIETRVASHSYIKVSKLSIDTILLELNLIDLSVDEQVTHFGMKVTEISSSKAFEFIQDYDFVLDKKALLNLDIDSKYCLLKKGKYPIEISNNTVSIILKLSEK